MVSFFPPTKLLWLFPWGHWQGCSGFSFPILKVNASKGLNLHPRNVKEVNCFNLITCGLWLCMGHQAVTCNELAIWKSSGELVKNRDARAHGLKFWFSTSENLFKKWETKLPRWFEHWSQIWTHWWVIILQPLAGVVPCCYGNHCSTPQPDWILLFF